MTVLEFIVPQSPQRAKDFRDAAELCSKLAKLCQGAMQRALYAMKAECLACMFRYHAGSIVVKGDSDRHRGLLSVALRTQPRRRIHTHENWLPAA